MNKQIAKYGVISHYPAANRTEHVNIGLVVFMPDGAARVHFGQDLKKLRAMDPSVNLETTRSWQTGLPKILDGMSAEYARSFLENFGSWKLSSALGAFSYSDDTEYLDRVGNALHSLVSAPPSLRGRRERVPLSQTAKELALMKAYVKKITRSPRDSKALLQRAGILNSKGELAKPYRG